MRFYTKRYLCYAFLKSNLRSYLSKVLRTERNSRHFRQLFKQNNILTRIRDIHLGREMLAWLENICFPYYRHLTTFSESFQ